MRIPDRIIGLLKRFFKFVLRTGISPHGRFTFTLRDLAGNIVGQKVYDNIVVNVAKNLFAGRINGEVVYTGAINYLALGTGSNTPASTDTTLQTEIARKAPQAGQTRTNNQVSFEFYFAPTEAIGNLKEVGAFIDGTASADTGALFDRAAIDVAKTSLNSLTVTLLVTVS